MAVAVEAVSSRSPHRRNWDQIVSAEELRTAYLDRKENLVVLGERYRCAPEQIRRLLLRHGIPTRDQQQAVVLRASTIHPAEVEKMASMYAAGMSSSDIGKHLGRNGRNVRDHLERAGIMRSKRDGVRLAVENGKIRKYHFREDFFDTLTPESAWVLGLIFGDGHVRVRIGQQYGVQLAGTKEVCTKVGALLRHDKLPRKMKDANCWMLEFYSRRLTERLAAYGLHGGKKAHTIRLPNIADALLPHFIRGAWDADGCWCPSAKSFKTTYVSASHWFITGLELLLKQHCSIEGSVYEYRTTTRGKPCTGYTLRYGSEASKQLRVWLYNETPTAIRCDRKYAHAHLPNRRNH